MKNLIANRKYILFKKMEQVEEETKISLIITPGDINPTLMYGNVLSTGHYCKKLYDGNYVYVAKTNAIQLIHLGEEYYIVHEDNILAYIEDEVKEGENI